MTAPLDSRALVSRRRLLAMSLALPLATPASVLASSTERTTIASVEREALTPPLTLGMARVVLRPGATAWAATPGGARIIVVESGVLAIASLPQKARPLTAAEFAVMAPETAPADELLVPAGTTMTFGAAGVASVRNPGARPVVALDVAVYREEARPLARAFTTDSGVSFQLLASANAMAAPAGKVGRRVGAAFAGSQSPSAGRPQPGAHPRLRRCGDAGRAAHGGGGVHRARRGLGALFHAGVVAAAHRRSGAAVTAGGVVFLPVGTEAVITNAAERAVDVLVLAVREVD